MWEIAKTVGKGFLSLFNSSNPNQTIADEIGDLMIKGREMVKGKEADPNLLIEYERQVLEYNLKLLQLKVSVVANDQNGNWLQRSWRPIFALVLVLIFANNTIFITYFEFAKEIDLNFNIELLREIGLAISIIYGIREVEKTVKGVNLKNSVKNIFNGDISRNT